MTELEDTKQAEEKKEDSEEEKEESHDEERVEDLREDASKAFSKVKSSIDTLTDVVQSLAETQKGVSDTIGRFDSRLKALEKPTDLPLKPAGSAGSDNDVGADVKVPDTYQSNSRQVGLDSDRKDVDGAKKPSSDLGKLSMQEKSKELLTSVQKSEHTFSTETPRPSAALETVDKSTQDFSPILKDARSGGFEGLSQVARNILSGKYYKPTPEEVGQW